VGPSDEHAEAVSNVGVACHITAAAPGRGARRYDETLTKAQRSSIENGIWMCQTHAKLIDTDDVRFSSDSLLQMKRIAEGRARARLEGAAAGRRSAASASELHFENLSALVAAHARIVGRLRSMRGTLLFSENTDSVDRSSLLRGLTGRVGDSSDVGSPLIPQASNSVGLFAADADSLLQRAVGPFLATASHAMFSMTHGKPQALSEPDDVRKLQRTGGRSAYVIGKAVFSEYSWGVPSLLPPTPSLLGAALFDKISDNAERATRFRNYPAIYEPIFRLPPCPSRLRVGFVTDPGFPPEFDPDRA
jgi:hypothetical protein